MQNPRLVVVILDDNSKESCHNLYFVTHLHQYFLLQLWNFCCEDYPHATPCLHEITREILCEIIQVSNNRRQLYLDKTDEHDK